MKTIKILTLSAAIPLALMAGVPAAAQEGPRMGFGMFDLDGDGGVTLEELQSMPRGMIGRADTDGDGAVSRDELLAQAAERIDAMIAELDTDQDGLVTEEEMAMARVARERERRAAFAERMFERIDVDGDGVVTEEEFANAREDFMGRMGERGGRFGHGGFFGHRG